MPTLLTWSRWTPPFLGLGPGDFWAAAGGAADPLGWGRRRGEVTLPLTEFSAGEPLCLEKGSWRRHRVGGGTEDCYTDADGGVQGLVRGTLVGERGREKGPGRAGPRAPALPGPGSHPSPRTSASPGGPWPWCCPGRGWGVTPPAGLTKPTQTKWQNS